MSQCKKLWKQFLYEVDKAIDDYSYEWGMSDEECTLAQYLGLNEEEEDAWVSDSEDERVLNVTITELGEKLKEDAVLVPKKMGCCVCLEKEDADELYRLLHKVLGVLGKE